MVAMLPLHLPTSQSNSVLETWKQADFSGTDFSRRREQIRVVKQLVTSEYAVIRQVACPSSIVFGDTF